ncbi:MAG: hypothetical protein IJN56_02310 [Clostridia bacterium]|nr:hypothetical protein [Clostridia bacterium]
MKIEINKSAKRVLSIALSLAMVIGTLFTANVGTNIIANAETPIAEGTIDLLEFGTYLTDMGSTSTFYDTKLADNGETGADWENAIIIDSAEELVYLCKGSGDDTDGKYYKVADGLAGFNLASNNLDIDGTLADNLAAIQAAGKNHAGGTPGFQGYFDGNGATVYGAWTNHESVSTYAGLFTCTKGDVTIKNINVNKASFTATTAAGGIVGYYLGEGNYTNNTTLTIENCSVTDSHIEVTSSAWGRGLGAIVGSVTCPSGYTDANDEDGDGSTTDYVYVNNKINITSCFVDLDEEYFISLNEGTSATGDQVCHGGVVGVAGSNALTVSDCIVLGVTPYATTISTDKNNVQHSGLESHFTNVYTDTGSLQAAIGGTLGTRNFTNKIFILTPEQMQGAAAVSNMNLAWFSGWIPGEEGEYPTINQTGEESNVSFWTGAAASEFAGGTGTKDDPFIIKTADQLYRALSTVTYTTSTSGDLAVETAESVAGGTQTDRIFKQGSTTVYAPVYTPYYYKVDDTVDAFYLNNVYGNETLAGAKAMVAAGTAKDWKPGKSFVGHLDGNGVTIYGMYSSTGQGLVYKLDGASTVKNINFNACYASGSGNSALVTTNLGSYTNDSTRIKISNISVRNSYIATTRAITLTARTDSSGCYDHAAGPAGIISTNSTPENLTISNCFYDGDTCERAIGASSEATIDMMGAIHSGTSSANNLTVSGCVSFGAPAVNEVYVSGKEVFYNRYDKNQGFEVFFYNSYTDMSLNEITTVYPDKYDKLKDITRIETKSEYTMYDMPKLSWGNWTIVTEGDRTFPIPTVNTAEQTNASYVELVGKGQNNYAGVGPYAYGSNPYTYLLKGAGTEEDPYIIETDIQLARAIATGGMNLYDKLYYKLGCDIDLSAAPWITQETRSEGGIYYTYTPFGGTLDGDGHTITGLSAGDSASAGLIPVLEGGTVKNLHLRDVAVVSGEYAGALVGWMYGGSVTNCSVEDAVISSAGGYNDGLYIVYNDDATSIDDYGTITNSYYVGKDGDGNDVTVYITDHNEDDGVVKATADEIKAQITAGETDIWYIGGKEGSLPRLVAQAEKMDCVDVDGDGIGNEYTPNDLSALRSKLLRKSAYDNIYGDVSRDGTINIADLAVLQRTIGDNYGESISDSFFANVQAGNIKIYYGENDNYDAARKVELYLEELAGVDVKKVVVDDSVAWGSSSDANATYVHQNDYAWVSGALYYPIGDSYGEITDSTQKAKYALDGELEIVVGNIAGTDYATNNVATAANTYAVTYDKDSKFVWLQGENFTAVEQAAINFTQGCSVQGDTVYTCGSTELSDEKKPITVKLDTNYDGVLDADTVLYYAWGDEFEGDYATDGATINTHNWQHNTQQSEAQNGEQSNYLNQEVAPVKDLSKVIVIEDGRLSMKRGYDSSSLGTSTNGYVALDVEPGEFNGYHQDGVNAIDADGSDVYFSSGKVTTERGMLYKQGYLEIEGQLPADGHAFPAWWLMGRPAQSATNKGYDNSLYGKVYKYNTNWDGVSNAWDKTNLNTYKYQIPSAIYEIDMIEVMQAASRVSGRQFSWESGITDREKSWKTAVGWYGINTTIHKWWNNGVDSDANLLYIHDWDNYQVLGGIANDAFSTTSSEGSWIHNPGSTLMDFGSTSNCASVSTTARDDLQKSRRYGFSWYTDAETGFEATLYVYNDDGSVRQTLPIASGASIGAMKDDNGNTEANGAIGANAGIYSDAKVFNQYMYVLLDNKYYSANEAHDGGATVFTDLLTAAGLTSLEIEYVRVYQQDGERDIVTQETENFNNNNHFGYK